jgi:hypothetical protein
MPYKCRACGNVQEHNGPCNGLMHPGGWYDNMMDMVESNQRVARDMNIGFYGDGGLLRVQSEEKANYDVFYCDCCCYYCRGAGSD